MFFLLVLPALLPRKGNTITTNKNPISQPLKSIGRDPSRGNRIYTVQHAMRLVAADRCSPYCRVVATLYNCNRPRNVELFFSMRSSDDSRCVSPHMISCATRVCIMSSKRKDRFRSQPIFTRWMAPYGVCVCKYFMLFAARDVHAIRPSSRLKTGSSYWKSGPILSLICYHMIMIHTHTQERFHFTVNRIGEIGKGKVWTHFFGLWTIDAITEHCYQVARTEWEKQQ